MTAVPAMRSCRARCSRCTRMLRNPRPKKRKLSGNTSARTIPLPRLEGRAICPDDADAEHGHAEAPAARRPRVTEVKELPGSENDGDDDICPVPADRMAGYDLHNKRSGRQTEGKQASADHEVDDERQEPRYRARVVPLRTHPASGLRSGAHDCAWASSRAAGAGGPGCLRRSRRPTQRSMN